MLKWNVIDETTQQVFLDKMVHDLESIHSTKINTIRYDEDAIRTEL